MNRTTVLMHNIGAPGEGDAQIMSLARDPYGILQVWVTGAPTGWNGVIEGRTDEDAAWAQITTVARADLPSGYATLAKNVVLMPEMRARLVAISGGTAPKFFARVVQ